MIPVLTEVTVAREPHRAAILEFESGGLTLNTAGALKTPLWTWHGKES